MPIDALDDSAYFYGPLGATISSAVSEALELLGDREKQILYLCYFKELPQDRIAEELGIPLGTVKSRLHYAKQKFKENYPHNPDQKGEKAMIITEKDLNMYLLGQRLYVTQEKKDSAAVFK